MEAATLIKTLQDHSYVHVPIPLTPDIIDEALRSFFLFLDQDEEVRNHIQFSIAPLHRRGDVGFVHRDPGDHIYNDSKDFFHYHPAIFEKYGDFLKTQPVVRDFMGKAQAIWEVVYAVVSEALKALETTFPNIHGKIFDTDCPHVLLRFLKYDWQTSGKYLAKPHFDAGSFTLAIAESCPGLRIGSSPENLQFVEYKEGQGVFMLSSNVEKVFNASDHNLSPGWHDVVQVDETQVGKPFARWALVAFIEAHSVEALSRNETHKWYKGEAA